MSSTGDRFSTLRAPGLSVVEAEHTALAVLSASSLTVRHLADGRIGVSYSRRPTWTIVLAVILFPVGLLFLLVRSTEAGEVIVVDGPTGPVVTVPPVVDIATHTALDQALRTGGVTPDAEAVTPPSVPTRPVGVIGDIPGIDPVVVTPAPAPVSAVAPEVGRHDDFDAATVVSVGAVTSGRAVLRFASGSVVVAPGESVTLGRAPAAPDGGRSEPIPGDTSTVSRSHAVVAYDGPTLTVRDLHSTNGTTVTPAGGAPTTVPPGVPTPVSAGFSISFGAASCEVALESIDNQALR